MDAVGIVVAAVAVGIAVDVVAVIVAHAEIFAAGIAARHLRDKGPSKELKHHVDAKTSEVAQAAAWPNEGPGEGRHDD
jgi:hypothetical protein